MEIQVIEKQVPSSDGIHTLKGLLYVPNTEIKGFFQVVHGMTEHIRRYDKFMRSIAENGYLVFGYDHLGHGYTANSDDELGFIADKDGWKYLCQDVTVFSNAVREEYGSDLPYYLMGHSMGSFIVRLNTWLYGKPDKLIVMGTGGPNPVAGIGLFVIDVVKLFKGKHGYSKFVENLAFGTYNDKFKEENDSISWLTKDTEIRKIYASDKYCTFHFTVSALHDLVTMNKLCNTKKWFGELSKEIPILLVSGEEDPVGGNGVGVKQVFDGLKETGHNVDMVLYPGCRHEILNDSCKEEVIEKILSFIK